MKIIKSDLPNYESPDESFGISEFNSATVYNSPIYNALLQLIPENFRDYNNYLKAFSNLSSYIISKEITLMEDINNIYNPDLGSKIVIDFLASRYSIVFPVDYDLNQKRLILKYYPNFIKIKGTEFAIKILDFINRTESDLYSASQLGNYKIEYYYEGYTLLHVTDKSDQERISKYLKFAQNLIDRITPAGMYSKIIIDN